VGEGASEMTEREKESSRRCGALPRAEVIDRGCSENGGVIRRAGLRRRRRRKGRRRDSRETDGDGARKREVARRLVGRGAKKERQRRKGSTKCT
jgi:hypothetical protein